MAPDPRLSIAVIGGGVIGITTALVLQLAGFRTVVYAKMQPSCAPDAERPPEFATLHAAASVLPHSVASPKVSDWTSISQEFFRALSFPGGCGVRRQVHYEVFEDPIETLPGYAGSVDNFELLTADELTRPWVPKRSGAGATHGWKFDAFFCEAPEYLRALYALYADSGGRIAAMPAAGDLASYLATDHEILVNCTGIAAHSLLAPPAREAGWADEPMAPAFEPLIDPVPPKLIRGHYLRMDIKSILTGFRGQFFSYNYKPSADIYRTATGAPADVYCYPRSDAWILGGSRQAGKIDGNGAWIGEETVGGEIEFARPNAPALAVPAAILQLNSDILLRLSNGRLDLQRLARDDPAMVSPGIGYRFLRASDSDSVRLGCSRVRVAGSRKYILHNYGHGGSGFTLSWGCAFDILQMLGRVTGASPTPMVPTDRAKFVTGYAALRLLLIGVLARLLSEERSA